MKRILTILFLLLTGTVSQAQYIYHFWTSSLSLGIDESGKVRSVNVFDKEILSSENCPVAVAFKDGKMIVSNFFECNFDYGVVGFGESGNIGLSFKYSYDKDYFKIVVDDAPMEAYDAILLFPICVSLNENVGEVIGVAQGQGLAFGMQALNAKTNAGVPSEYAEQVEELFHYSVNPELAAVTTTEGTRMQFSAYDRFFLHYRNTNGYEGAVTCHIDGEDALIRGSALALFGCHQDEVLDRIAEIEADEGLAHPVHDSIWNKVNPMATKSYLCNEYTAKDAAFISKKCHQAGLDLCRPVWANRIPTDAPIVLDNLLIQGILELQLPIDANQTEFAVYHSDLFNKPAHINVLQIDDELVTYRSTEIAGNIHLFYGCTRGAFGTKKAAHNKNNFTYKLWDHPDHTLVPNPKTQDEMVQKEAKKCAKTESPILVFNDLKSYAYNGLGELSIIRLLDTMQKYNPEKFMQADQLMHNSWHYLTRVNDNTLWNATMRNTMSETLSEKQAFYRRNLFPWMIGNFQIHLADKNRTATTMEEREWFLSKASAFEAGFGLDFSVNAMRKHGLSDAMLNTIKIWETLRLASAFSEDQKEAFKDPYGNWHLEKSDDSTYLLYPQHISRRYFCNYKEDTWQWDIPYQGSFALCIAVEGKGSISQLEFTIPNGVLHFPCTLKAGQYLLYNFDGSAYITDANYNKIADVEAQGVSILDEGISEISFTCEVKTEERKKPDVSIRYYTHGNAQRIKMQSNNSKL